MDEQPKNNFSIIFLDDEEKAVKYFEKMFGKYFNIISTTNPKEVLKIIEDRPGEIAVVISDQRMPETSGTDVLTEVKERNYYIVRVLTTAYSDLKDNIEAINKGSVFAYLTKPWDVEEVRSVLNKAIREFESTQRYLSLSGSIAHEMRNPFNTIKESTKNAKKTLEIARLNERVCDKTNEKITPIKRSEFDEIAKALEMSLSSAKRGNMMIDVILNSIRQKPIDPDGFSEIPASKIINMVITEYAFKPAERERVKVDIAPDHDFIIRCNDVLLSYVFFNLLRNSLYYVKTHPDLVITITTEMAAKTGGDGFNKIHFRDTGPGIPEGKVGSLFEAFSTFGKRDGTGLGLAFCKRTMRNFGGDISCKSEEGKFSEFTLSFPKTNEDGNAKVAMNNVLLIDDQKMVLLTTKKLLERHLESTYCDMTDDAFEGIEKAKNNKYDIILMDIEMPEIDGVITTRKIREFDKNTPIVAYSSKHIESMQEIKDAGFDDYKSKNSSHNVIVKTVSKWANIRLKEDLLTEDNVEALLKGKNLILVDDERANLLVTSKYLEKYQVKTRELHDGSQVIDAMSKGEHDLILMDIEMHEMDGITATKGIRELEKEGDKHIPIIAITGNDSVGRIREILSCGFDDYFIKGKDYRELAQTIAFWVGGSK